MKVTNSRSIRLAIAAALAAGTCQIAGAVGLGPISVNSHIGEPLRASINVSGLTASDAAGTTVGIASDAAYRSRGIKKLPSHNTLRFNLHPTGGGNYVISVSSPKQIREPFINFVLNVHSGGKDIVREYAVFLDPANGGAVLSPAVSTTAPQPVTSTIKPSKKAVASTTAVDVPEKAVVDTTALAQLTPASRSDHGWQGKVIVKKRITAASVTTPPEVAASAEPAAAPQSHWNGRTYGPVKPGETLYSIAEKVRPSANYSIGQVMRQIYYANRGAFASANLGSLMAGYKLTIPDFSKSGAVSTPPRYNQRPTTSNRTSRAAKAAVAAARAAAQQKAQRSAASDAAEQAANTASQAAEQATDTVQQAAQDAREAAGQVVDAADNAAEQATDTLSNTADTLSDAASNAADNAADTLSDAADTAANLADKAAETVSNSVDQAGEALDNASDQAAQALDNMTEQAGNALDATAEQASDALDNAQDKAAELADNAADKVENLVDQATTPGSEDNAGTVTDVPADQATPLPSQDDVSQDNAQPQPVQQPSQPAEPAPIAQEEEEESFWFTTYFLLPMWQWASILGAIFLLILILLLRQRMKTRTVSEDSDDDGLDQAEMDAVLAKINAMEDDDDLLPHQPHSDLDGGAEHFHNDLEDNVFDDSSNVDHAHVGTASDMPKEDFMDDIFNEEPGPNEQLQAAPASAPAAKAQPQKAESGMDDFDFLEFEDGDDADDDALFGDTAKPAAAQPAKAASTGQSNNTDWLDDLDLGNTGSSAGAAEAKTDAGSTTGGVSSEEMEINLDLALSFIATGHGERAESWLEEVLESGNADQKARAQKLLKKVRGA